VGDAEGQRKQDIHMKDSSAPTEGSLGASQLGAEQRHDKSPVEPEHTEPQNQQSRDITMQDDEPEQRQKDQLQREQQQQKKQQQRQKQPDPQAPPKDRATQQQTKKTPSGATVAATQQQAKRPTPKDIAKAQDTKAAERQAKLQRAGGEGKLVAATGASAAVTDRRMVVSGAKAAEAASTKMQLHRHGLALAGPSAGFMSYRTTSGHSFGSLEGYVNDWNDADADEVTSQMMISDPKHVNPAIGIAERKVDQAVQALRDAKTATKVRSCSCFGAHIYIPSPRDLGRMSIIRPESLNCCISRPKHMLLSVSPRVPETRLYLIST
jgi:hypothetical protein